MLGSNVVDVLLRLRERCNRGFPLLYKLAVGLGQGHTRMVSSK